MSLELLDSSLDELIRKEKNQKRSGKNIKDVARAQSKASSNKRSQKINQSRGINNNRSERAILPPPPAVKEVKSFKISVKNDGKLVGPKIDNLTVSVSSSGRSGIKQKPESLIGAAKQIKIYTTNNRAGKSSSSSRSNFVVSKRNDDRRNNDRRDSRRPRGRSNNNNNNSNNNNNNNNRRNSNNNNDSNEDNNVNTVFHTNSNTNNNNETKFTVTTGNVEPFFFNAANSNTRVIQQAAYPVQQTAPQDNVLSAVMSSLNAQSSQQGTTLNERFTRLRQNLDNVGGQNVDERVLTNQLTNNINSTNSRMTMATPPSSSSSSSNTTGNVFRRIFINETKN